MPNNFSFSSDTLADATYLTRAIFTDGSGSGVDNPSYDSAAALGQSISPRDDVDVFSIALVAGQTYVFDIDNGSGGSSYVDLQLDLINSRGSRVESSDNPGGNTDPRLVFEPDETGIYYVAVHQAQNDYVNGGFRFQNDGRDTGDYTFNVSSPDLPALSALTDGDNTRNYSDRSQRVLALDGDDVLDMNGGNDIALGGAGNDEIQGGGGSDELVGGSGRDRLEGQSGKDALVGDSGNDVLYGGSNNDNLNGGTGNDLLIGDSGRDRIWGEAGNDKIFGGEDNDFLRGGAGIDTLYGGAGEDTFHFLRGEAKAGSSSVEDRIEDFQDGDLIDFGDLYSGELRWRGTGSFTDDHQVRAVVFDNGYIDVRVNLDDDSSSELEVLVDLEGNTRLGADDFIL